MDWRVQVAVESMKNHLDRDFSLDELARHVNLSPSRLRGLFATEVGLSPVQYLRALRMEQARRLLDETWLGVKQIVLELGLNDRSHFEREFKRAQGMTPVQYRSATRLRNLTKANTLHTK
jgi:AraC-like DNA-binding protein